VKGIKLGQKEIDGKKRITLEDTCSVYYKDDKGNLQSEIKENSPCRGIFSLVEEIKSIKETEDEPDIDEEEDEANSSNESEDEGIETSDYVEDDISEDKN
jgi:hypothetical protein